MKNALSQRIKRLITVDGKSQKSFAEKVGLSRQTINNIITTNTQPDFTTIHKIAVAYPDLNVRWLLTGDEPMFYNFAKVDQQVNMVAENVAEYKTKVTTLIDERQKLMEKVMELQDYIIQLKNQNND